MDKAIVIAVAAVIILAAGIGLYYATKGGGDDPPSEDSEVYGMDLILTVDGKRVDVAWEDNSSVNALKGLAKDGLTINMERYGGFEQTGKIGRSIVSDDSNIHVGSGDIVLYNDNQVCLYFDDNTYSFTRLGKITGMSESEIRTMLDRPSVTAVLSLE